MRRADWESATPKCPKGEVANVPGQVCGEPLRWKAMQTTAGTTTYDGLPQRTQTLPTVDDAGAQLGFWECGVHGRQFTGREAARRGGFVVRMEFVGSE